MILNKLIFFSFFLFFGCFGNNQSDLNSDELIFFNLKEYFEDEVERLKEVKNISKTTEVNGQIETLKLESIDFKTDLEIFSNSDINKPSWKDKYSIDSLRNEVGQLSKLIYKTENPKLKIKSLEVLFKNEAISEINISKYSSSAISEVQETLKYNPRKGYTIERSQDITMSGKNDFKVNVKFN